MGSIEIDGNIDVNNDKQKLGPRDSVNRLHDLVHKLEEENDLPLSPKKTENPLLEQVNGHTLIKEDDSLNNNDRFSLENVGPVPEFEYDADFDSDDSWLFESPQKQQTPGPPKSSENWLKEDISTPELLRVRGSLSATLEIIAIEKRKGQMEKLSNRKTSKHSRRGSGHSVHSLDWDYDEAKVRSNSYNRSKLSNEELQSEGYFDDEQLTDHFIPEYRSDNDLRYNDVPDASQLVNLSKSRSAKKAVDPDRQFSLDWSDEEDLQPMQLEFDASPHQAVQRRGFQVAPNPAVVRRGASGLSTPRGNNYEYDDFVAKPSGMVKPRRAVDPDDTDFRAESPQSDDFDPNAPVVPRSAKRANRSISAAKRSKISFAKEPVIMEETYRPKAFETVTPRGGISIAKPVQRRAPPDNAPRLRAPGSASNLLKPRAGNAMAKSHSASELQGNQDDGLKVNFSAGSGAVVRRRGAPAPTAEPSVTPRRAKEPALARVQGGGIPQVRRSTGSIPTKNDGNAPRPRRSHSPSGARPRGQAVTQSWQADY